MWVRVDTTKEEIGKLKDKWEWSPNNLRLAGIGTPKLIIDDLMNSKDKHYTPFVPAGSIRKNKAKLIANKEIDFEKLFAEAKNVEGSTLFDEEKQRVLELAGTYLYSK